MILTQIHEIVKIFLNSTYSSEMSSNKCKTFIAKHHFIILHNALYLFLLISTIFVHSIPPVPVFGLFYYAISASSLSNCICAVSHPNNSLG